MLALNDADLQHMLKISEGRFSFGKGQASGNGRIHRAIGEAFSSCNPEITDFARATAVALHVLGSPDLTMEEFDEGVTLALERFQDDIQVFVSIDSSEALTDCLEVRMLVGGC